MAKIETDIYDYVRAPRSIVFAQDLTSAEKILLLILIDKCKKMEAFNHLQPDGSFYITGKEMESKMDIKKDQILKKYIPKLESKGFINKISRPEDKEGVYKTYCFFTLNWGAILNHKGDKKDEEVQAKRAAKAEAIKTRQPKKRQEMVQQDQIESERGENDCDINDYYEYCQMRAEEERREEQEQAERKRNEENRIRQNKEQQQSFDLAEITIQDDLEDAATMDIRVNGSMYDAGQQWWGYM